VQAASIEPAELDPFVRQVSEENADAAPLEQQVARTIELLNQSDRPVLIAGNGLHLAKSEKDFLDLVDRLRIPVLTTWLGLDLIPDSHALAMGRPGAIAPRGANFTLQNADLLLVVGTRLDAATTGYNHANLARAARKVMVDIDPSEIRKMQTPINLAVCADAGRFVRELMRQSGNIAPRSRSSWISLCRQWKEKYPVVLPEHRQPGDVLSMYHFSELLAEQLAEGEVVASGSSGFACEIFLLTVNVKPRQRIFHARGLGAMGFGLPAAIGACLANQRRRVICVDGDGGFQMNIQELETVARHHLPIKFFVVNNDGYASIRSSQTNYFEHLVAADSTSGLTVPDIRKVAAAYGVPAVRLEPGAGVAKQIGAVLDSAGPMICEVPVLRDEPRQPRLASVQMADGSMVSRPLEDLWPFLEREEFRRNMLVPTIEE
jgi:acetolactate synthase-1/2/3 large subunit